MAMNDVADIAWAIAKMPVVSGSYDSRGEYGARAKFYDPVSGEVLDMIVDDEGDGVHGYIFDEGADPEQIYHDAINTPPKQSERRETGPDGWFLDDDDDDFTTTEAEFTGGRPLTSQRARALGVIMGEEPNEKQDYPVDWSTMGMLETYPPYKSRGYATALYDLISYYLSQRGNNVLIPGDLTPDGARFWESARDEEKAGMRDIGWFGEGLGWNPPSKSYMEDPPRRGPLPMGRKVKKSSDLIKMPIVPGSYRAGDIDEGDENYEDRQRYLMDFYDPVDDKTRTMNILPTWKRKESDKQRGRGLGMLLGGGAPIKGTTVDIELDEDEIGEGEELFGRNQKVPFGFAYQNRNLDRLFVPSDMRRRGMGTAIADALTEHRNQDFMRRFGKTVEDGLSDDSDNIQTKDMLAFWANRGYMPDVVYPMPMDKTMGDEQYWRRKYVGFGKYPDYNKQGPFEGDFEEAWQSAVDAGQTELKAEKEKEDAYEECWKRYEDMANMYASRFGFENGEALIDADFDLNEKLREMGMPDKYIHEYDGETTCECWEGHPWYHGEDWDDHEEKKMTKYPHSNIHWNNMRSLSD